MIKHYLWKVGEKVRNSAIKNSLANIWNLPKKVPKKVVCFTGDDGYETDYTLIKELCEKHGIPYTFAIQCNNIGKTGFMSASQMMECANSPYISFAVHCMEDTKMSDVTPEELSEIYNSWYQYMNTHNYISDGYIAPILYNHGVTTDLGINETVAYYTRCGCTTVKGVNAIPMGNNRFKMKRNGLFPTDGSYTIAQAKSDLMSFKLSPGSGIMVFMTHSNTSTFDINQLEEFMLYCVDNGMTIMHINEAVELMDTYYIPVKPVYNWEEVEVTLYPGVSRLGAWNGSNPGKAEINLGGSSVLRLTQPIDVSNADKAKVSGYTSGYYCTWAFYKDDPTVYSNIIQYGNFPSSVAGTNGNFTSNILEVPSNAKYLLVSGTDQGGGRNYPQVSLAIHESVATPSRPKPVYTGLVEFTVVDDEREAPTPII